MTASRRFSDRERRILRAVAAAAIPAGERFPAAGERTCERVESTLAEMSEPAWSGYRALLWAADASARLSSLRGMSALSPDRAAAVLDGWSRASLARRLSLRGLLSPIKIAHFDDPELFAAIGCQYELDPVNVQLPRYRSEKSHDTDELGGDETIECDVVVVGTGAGGAVMAKELAERGLAVILVEEGNYFDRRHFNGRSMTLHRLLYRDSGATISVGNAVIPVPVGMSVGGSTTVNCGTCYRVPGRILRKWRDELGLTEFTVDEMARYYEQVEAVLQVEPGKDRYLGGVARVVARGCQRLGIADHRPISRNAPECEGLGLCTYGCPTDAKRSTNVSYVPLALRAGAELFYHARVDQILTSRGRVAGITAHGKNSGNRLTIRANTVVLSCGSLMTPVLLQKNSLLGGSGQLGKNLTLHPAQGVLALFDEDISGFSAIPQSYSIEEFHDEGLLFEGGSMPLDITMTAIPHLGPTLTEIAESFDRVAMFGFLIEDSNTGQVRSVGGRPFITYRLRDRDVARLKRGVDILTRVFLAGGAKAVFPLVNGFERFTDPGQLGAFRMSRLRASDFELSAYHPLGTARMGRDPGRSVVDTDHQAHELPGLYIADGSTVPSSPAVNPQLTIMAMATRAADRLARRPN